MKKSILRRSCNRVLHLIARFAPGSKSLRPLLHRLRGVTVKDGVFIGDDVYIDNEYPECVEIHENATISIKAIIIAHTRGPGRIVVGRDSFVGANAVICCSGRTILIGKGCCWRRRRGVTQRSGKNHGCSVADAHGGARESSAHNPDEHARFHCRLGTD